jgi:hypothetical protein
VCTFCPVGSYALAGAGSCTKCPAGYSAPINSVSKDACYKVASQRVAEHCDAGSAPIDGACTFCPTGTYALAGDQSCTHCPPGFWAPINSVSKDACYPLSAFRVAEHCDAGSAPIGGACTFCPTGTYALAGAQSCTPCPPGFWAPINSVSPDACYPLSAYHVAEVCDAGSAPQGGKCTFCPVGTYALAGAQSCSHCPSGQSAPINSVSKDACYPVAAHRLAEHCDAGSAPQNGQCTFCPVGTYALAGDQSCTHCPPGFWAPINSVSKDACYPLSAFKVAATCDAGSAPKNGVCTFCPVGSYALAAAQSCTKCPAGFSAPINSVSPDACYPLPAHHNFRDEASL